MSLRRERIERLIDELEYEVTRGIMEREIEPRFGARHLIPGGPTDFVELRIDCGPLPQGQCYDYGSTPKLKLVEPKGTEK